MANDLTRRQRNIIKRMAVGEVFSSVYGPKITEAEAAELSGLGYEIQRGAYVWRPERQPAGFCYWAKLPAEFRTKARAEGILSIETEARINRIEAKHGSISGLMECKREQYGIITADSAPGATQEAGDPYAPMLHPSGVIPFVFFLTPEQVKEAEDLITVLLRRLDKDEYRREITLIKALRIAEEYTDYPEPEDDKA